LFASGARENDTEELRRLFYVALTRAKSSCLFRTAITPPKASRWKLRSSWPKLAKNSMLLPRRKITLDDDVIAEFSVLHFTAPVAPEVAHLEDELTNRLVAGFVMNVSALNNFLKCPLEFYFRNIVRIPSPRNEAMEFGSAVHHALENLFLKMQERQQHLSAAG
jgi:DNA helicase-2/ATP-dependent DNA helicase PcrA